MSNAASRYELPAQLDLKAAAPLAAEIALFRGRDVVLDASSVTRLGGLCLQVLLAAREAWQSDEKAFAVDAPSPAFIADATLLGGAQYLSVLS